MRKIRRRRGNPPLIVSVCRHVTNIGRILLGAWMSLVLVQCGPGDINIPRLKRDLPPGDTPGELSWSPGRRCVAFNILNAQGHSPMTTTRVAVASASAPGFREVRLPPPNQIFSTFVDDWESPEVLRIHATTLDGEVHARYFCRTHQLEFLK